MRGELLLSVAVLGDLLAALISRGIEVHRFHRAELTAIKRGFVTPQRKQNNESLDSNWPL